MCTFSRRLNPSLKCTQLLMEICQIAQTTYFPNDQDCLVGNTFFWYSQYLLLSRIFNHEGVIMMKGAIPSSYDTFSDIRTLFPCFKNFGNVKELAAMFLLLLLKLKNNKFLEKLQRQEF